MLQASQQSGVSGTRARLSRCAHGFYMVRQLPPWSGIVGATGESAKVYVRARACCQARQYPDWRLARNPLCGASWAGLSSRTIGTLQMRGRRCTTDRRASRNRPVLEGAQTGHGDRDQAHAAPKVSRGFSWAARTSARRNDTISARRRALPSLVRSEAIALRESDATDQSDRRGSLGDRA